MHRRFRANLGGFTKRATTTTAAATGRRGGARPRVQARLRLSPSRSGLGWAALESRREKRGVGLARRSY